jgi:hypothetical protein
MCLFAPYFLHNNNIRVNSEEQLIAFRPVIIPRSRGRLITVIPSFIHDNQIGVVSNKTDVPPCFDDNGREIIDFVIGMKSVPTTQEMGVITEEMGEKQQMKLLDQEEVDEKWKQTKEKLGEAKKNFQKSYNQLEEELISVKAEL